MRVLLHKAIIFCFLAVSLDSQIYNPGGAGGSSVSLTATSPIVVTPSPATGTAVISCPTCGSGGIYPAFNKPDATIFTPLVAGAFTFTGVSSFTNKTSRSVLIVNPSSNVVELKSIPSAPYTLQAFLDCAGASGSGEYDFGIVIRNSATSVLRVMDENVSTSSTQIRKVNETGDGTGATVSNATTHTSIGSRIWFRIDNDTSTWTYSFSTNGSSYTPLTSVSVLSDTTFDQWGLTVYSGTTGIPAVCDIWDLREYSSVQPQIAP